MIIIVRGISIQEIMTKTQEVVAKNKYIEYSELPKRFTSVEEWPKYTNLLCWECSRSISSYPKFIAKNPSIVNGNDICDPEGVFHTWNCGMKFAESHYTKDKCWDLHTSTLIFAKKFPDFNKTKIPAALEKTKMKQYCGAEGITCEEYDELVDKLA